MKKYIYILMVGVFALSSCKKEEVGGTSVQDMANEWYVQMTVVDKATGEIIDDSDKDYTTLATYNTADNASNVMWMDNSDSYNYDFALKAKVNVDLANKTFSYTDADELYYGEKVTITNGKIVKDGAVGPSSKAVTDAISFDAEFSQDPGTIYRFNGYARTRFPGDDH